MPYLPTLRLFFSDGVYNNYRLKDGRVEFQLNAGPWRVLDDSDVQLHYRFDTEVARWLRSHEIEANPHAKPLSRSS